MRASQWILLVAGAGLGCQSDASGPRALPSPSTSRVVAATYTEVSLAPLSIARAINARGVAVGQLFSASGSRGGVRYPDGRVVSVGVLPGDNWSDASDVNEMGQVIGRSSNDSTGVSRGFIWDRAGGIRPLGSLGGVADFPASINDRGVVVGYSSRVPSGVPYPTTATLQRPGGALRDLGSALGSPASSAAFDINSQQQIIGQSDFGPFLWSPEDGTYFLPLPAGAYANAINSNGVIVGSYWNAALGKSQAYRWSRSSGFTDIGPAYAEHGVAWDVADDGTIVGYLFIAGVPRAFAARGRELLEIGGDQSLALSVNRCGIVSGVSNSSAVMWVPAGRSRTGVC